MPNWCDNVVTITGDRVMELMEAVKGEKFEKRGETLQQPFSLHSILPQPEELTGTNSPNYILPTQEEADAHNEEHKNDDFFPPAQTQEEVDALYAKYGSANWLDWREDNWGTKWDVSYDMVSCEYDAGFDQIVGSTDLSVVYEFPTAWGPPIGIYLELKKRYPDLDISWFYHEPDMQFAGYLGRDNNDV